MASKINQILTEWAPGDLHSLYWLKQRRVSRSLARHYHDNGSLVRISSGIYKRAGEQPSWAGGVRLLQEEHRKNFHVSGKTALELIGAGHFGSLSKRPQIFLSCYTKIKPPIWLQYKHFNGKFVIKNSSMFSPAFFLNNKQTLLVKHEIPSGIKIKISCRELAILELINHIDLKNSLETAENYVNMMYGVRFKLVQQLLENCMSIKVKRVFLYLSEKIGLKYFNRLDLHKINLGKGKRQIVKYNATLDKKYLITVDKEHDGDFL